MQSKELKQELAKLLEEKERRVRENLIETYFPDEGPYRRELYPKHVAFMAAGAKFNQRAFIAANRVGKSLAGCYEMTCHLTGVYPQWWKGRRFKRPINAWICGLSAVFLKESVQELLFGNFADMGTGMIPKAALKDPQSGELMTWNMPGVPNCIGTFLVNHISGGKSKVEFKTYEQGWQKFQGAKRDVIWLDEEPTDPKIYSECLTRTAGSDGESGIIYCTFTPLLGLSDVVLQFLPGGRVPPSGVNPDAPHRFSMAVDWADVPHLSEAWKEEALASYLPHERAARAKGIPALGSGAIYPVDEDTLLVEPFLIPPYWPRAYGMDHGWEKTAAIWGAIDPNTNVLYLFDEYYAGHDRPEVHAAAIRGRGSWINGACDPAGINNTEGTLMIDLFREQGLQVSPANKAVDAGLHKVFNMMVAGRLKIFRTCQNWLTEFRTYRRDENGRVVKKNDHLMDAMRYLVMTGLDLAEAEPATLEDDYRPMASGRNEITGY